ncbi:MAG: chromosome condensation regulator, partial [Clostridiales bacterium]|nr:chromosome condensation regulator [Clostridiales bacterium]
MAAVKADGTVVAKATSIVRASGQFDVLGWSEIVSVAVGYRHTVGLRRDGTVVAVGSNSYGQCAITDWKGIVAIAAGDNHTVGLRS